jgi:outer membrane protein TolC
VRAAYAATDEAAANYRGVVLAAFQQVEDNQSLLTYLGSALVDQQAATDAADRSLRLSMSLYTQGAVSYLEVVTAQVAALQAHLTLLGLQTSQLRASVQLVRALGGGWSSDELVPERSARERKSAGGDERG